MFWKTKNYLFLTLLILVLSCQISLGQSYWKISPNSENYAAVGNDTSLVSLKRQVSNEKWYVSDDALILLAYHHGDKAKEFILDELQKPSGDTSSFNYWNKYYFYNLMRGYLGVKEAVAAMDSVVKAAKWELKSLAIMRLAEAGKYDYFELVEEAFTNGKTNYMLLLEEYGNSRYKGEVGNYLEKIIKDSTSNIALEAASIYSGWNEERVIDLLEKRFYDSEGNSRKLFYSRLEKMDPHNQVGRAVWAIKNETDDNLKIQFIPAFKWIKDGDITRSFITPSFVLFLTKMYENTSSGLIKGHIKNAFLKDYKPLPPDSTISNLSLLDSLISTKDLIATEEYNWIGKKGFVKELNNRLSNARRHLQKEDLKNAVKQLDNFIKRIEQIYENADNRRMKAQYVTSDGYKFLFYKARYLLNRLPDHPSSENNNKGE